MPEEVLGAVDIDYLNVLCVKGLPGSESVDIAACRRQLDKWAAMVWFDTQRHLYKFEQNPQEYENSEAYLRLLALVSVLQMDLGVHYNMERVRNVDFTKSQDLFIHGMHSSDDGGTCVSMPVLYTAVARRLGNPVKLVLAKWHNFPGASLSGARGRHRRRSRPGIACPLNADGDWLGNALRLGNVRTGG